MSGRKDKEARRLAPAKRTVRPRWLYFALLAGLAVVIGAVILVVHATPPSPSANVDGPSVQFVGSGACSTDAAQPYGNGHAPSTNGPAAGQAIAEMPHSHLNPPSQVQYNHNPPTSGCHYNVPGSAPVPHGVYDQTIGPEYWVHNLEHGYIVVLYNCPSGCAADFQKLKTWYQQQPPDPALPTEKKILVLPWTSMTAHFAAVSWDWYQPMDTLDLSLLQRFYANHLDQSPESNQAA